MIAGMVYSNDTAWSGDIKSLWGQCVYLKYHNGSAPAKYSVVSLETATLTWMLLDHNGGHLAYITLRHVWILILLFAWLEFFQPNQKVFVYSQKALVFILTVTYQGFNMFGCHFTKQTPKLEYLQSDYKPWKSNSAGSLTNGRPLEKWQSL